MRSEPSYDYYAVISPGGAPEVLMFEEAGGWTLPHFETKKAYYWPVVDHVNETFSALLGFTVTTLRCIYSGFDAYVGRGRRIYEMENQSQEGEREPPAGGAWIDREQLTGLTLVVPQHRLFLETWFDEAESGSYPELRPPWTRRGWYAGAVGWAGQRLKDQGLTTEGSPRQVRTWGRSCVLQVPSSGGEYYFKALPEMFAHEPPLTAALSEWHRGSFPRVAALDNAQHWMLMPGFGGKRLDTSPDIEVWEDAFRTFARLQIDLASRTEQLESLGCPWRPLYWLADQVDVLLEDTEALGASQDGLTTGEVEELRSLGPRLKEMCEELAFHRVPFSLEHGDLFSENIALTESGFLYFDWSDSSIAHPFFSTVVVYSDPGSELPPVQGAHDRLRNAYLEPWQDFEPMDRLMDAFNIAQVLGPFHAAAGYYSYILPNMADRWEMESMLPYYLRLVLRNAAFIG